MSKEIIFNNLMKYVVEDYGQENVDKFVNWIKTDTYYLTAPASTRYHNNFEGGLLKHCINVTNLLIKHNAILGKPFKMSDVVIAGLFHDLGKGHKEYYIKTKTGKYKYGPIVKEVQHAVLSKEALENHFPVKLSDELLEAVLIHNGMYTNDGYMIFKNHKHSLLAWVLHSCDMISLKIEKVEKDG